MDIKQDETVTAGTCEVGKKKRKTPMTTCELFNIIFDILKEKSAVPDILDYWQEAHDSIPIMTFEFDLKNNLQYGSNEGIYLNFWIECCEDGVKNRYELGTFKTLREDGEAMSIMAELMAGFIVEEHRYVNAHLDDFTWTGVDVYVFDDKEEKKEWGFTCENMERALKRKDEMLKKYSCVVVRDNATRKTKKYKR